MEEQVYSDLRRSGDRMPSGFPEVKSGLDIRLLKHRFTCWGSKSDVHG
jgi:hypothetical protein